MATNAGRKPQKPKPPTVKKQQVAYTTDKNGVKRKRINGRYA